MRLRGGLRLWALLVLLLLAIPIIAAAQYSSGSADSLGVGDSLLASLLTPFSDSATFGDTLLAQLVQPYNDAVSFGDSLVAQLAQLLQPFSDAVSFGDTLVATLVQPFADSMTFGDTVLAELFQPYSDALAIGDSILAQLAQPYADSVSFGDQLSATLYSALNAALSDTLAIGEQLSAALLTPYNDAVSIGDQLSSALYVPYAEVVAVAEQVSTVEISVPGLPNSQITTDSSGNTIIRGIDSSGGLVTQVSLPPGTTMSPSVSVNYATSGANSITAVSGVTVPYPPGKTITMLNAAGVTSVCIVDSPAGATLQSAVCGETDLADSHVILPCDGSPHTYGPFPSGPSSRTYTCSSTSIGGQSYLQVSGLAYSTTILDATPPMLTLPSSVTAVLTSRAGAPVKFSATATDPLDPDPVVSCSRQSGSTFPIGTTTVTCTATDAAGNVATGSFQVSVLYRFGGFLPPLVAGGTYHIGSFIPVRFTLTDAAGREVYFATGKVTAGPVTGAFRSVGPYYEFDLDTRGMSAGPLTMSVSLNDGTTHSITVELTQSFPTSLSLYCSPQTVFVGATSLCEATVTSQGGPGPTGTVSFASTEGHATFGKVSCFDGGGALSCSTTYSSTSPGVQTISASYAGDSQDLPSSGSFQLTVTLIPTTTSLVCSPSSVQPGKETQCVATVQAYAGGSLTGGVAFSSSDQRGSFGKVACSPNSQRQGGGMTCTVDYTPSSSSVQAITAAYSGDASHLPSSASFVLNRGGGNAAGLAGALAFALVSSRTSLSSRKGRWSADEEA